MLLLQQSYTMTYQWHCEEMFQNQQWNQLDSMNLYNVVYIVSDHVNNDNTCTQLVPLWPNQRW